jgi:hypothetical protein
VPLNEWCGFASQGVRGDGHPDGACRILVEVRSTDACPANLDLDLSGPRVWSIRNIHYPGIVSPIPNSSSHHGFSSLFMRCYFSLIVPATCIAFGIAIHDE